MNRTAWASINHATHIASTFLLCMVGAVYAQDGALDTGYGLGSPTGTVSIHIPGMVTEAARMELDSSGRAWVATSFVRTEVASGSAGIVRFNASGQPDLTFNAGVTPGYVRLFPPGPNGVSDFTGALGLALDNPANPAAAYVLQQGSAISGRAPTTPSGLSFADLERPTPFTTRFGQYIAVSKVKTDGSLDTTYGSFGHSYVATGPVSATDIVRDPQGGVIVLSNSDFTNAFYLTRIGADGIVDASFGAAGTARVAGPSGSQVRAMSMVVDRQGRIVVVGTFSPQTAPGNWQAMIYRAQANGVADSSFGQAGMVITGIDAGGDNADVLNNVAIDAQDRIVAVGGSHNGDAFVAALCTALRVSSSGDSVRTFVVPNSVASHCTTLGVAVSGNGRVLMAARLQNANPPVKSTLIALDSGTFALDATFGSGGVGQPPEFMLDAFPMDVDIDALQRPLVAGTKDDQGRSLFAARYARPDKLLSDSFE